MSGSNIANQDQEIAESRERFNSDISDEDRKRLLLLLGAEMDKACITWHPGAVINPVLRAILRAERDTRERCIEELSEMQSTQELIPADQDSAHTYKVGFADALRDVAERIRGKGERT